MIPDSDKEPSLTVTHDQGAELVQCEPIAPDLEEAERFLTLLDPEASEFTFQLFDDDLERKNKRLAATRNGSLRQHQSELIRAQEAGAGVFVTVQETNLLGRNVGNIQRIRAVFQEDDGKGVKPPIEPHIVVQSSPGHYHRYWLVDGLSFEDFTGVMQTMVNNYGSDKNAKDLARVLRLPGFWNLKHKPKEGIHHRRFPVKIVHESGAQPYTREQILAAFPPAQHDAHKKSHETHDGSHQERIEPGQVMALRSALMFLRADDRELWVRMGLALKTLGDVGRGLWIDWSQTSAEWQPSDAQQWEGFQPSATHWRVVFSEAQAAGWVNPQGRHSVNPPEQGYEPEPPRFRLTPVSELLQAPPPLTWLVRDCLMPESNIFVVGEPAAGKSLLMLDWACCIARGVAWQGHKVQQGAVIYLAGEGHFGLRRRLKAWSLYREIDLDGCAFAISEQGASLAESEGTSLLDVIQSIDAFVAQHGAIVLIVVDTLHRNLGAADENSAKDLAVYFRNLDQLRARYRCAIATVHHTGHNDKQRSRGSSAIRGGVDIEFLVTTKGQGFSELTCSKMKDAPKPEPTAFEIVQVTLPWRDDQGREETSATIRQAECKKGGKADKKMPEGIRYGVESLHRAIQEHGQAGSVGVEEWRSVFYAGHTGDNQSAKKIAFQRCRKEMVSGLVASVENDRYRLQDGPGAAAWTDAHGFIQRLTLGTAHGGGLSAVA